MDFPGPGFYSAISPEALEGTIRHLLHLIGEIEALYLHNCIAEIIRENILWDLWLHTRSQDKNDNYAMPTIYQPYYGAFSPSILMNDRTICGPFSHGF